MRSWRNVIKSFYRRTNEHNSIILMNMSSSTTTRPSTMKYFHTNQSMINPSPVVNLDTNEQRLYKLKSIFETYDADGNGYVHT
jgi:hypothetical protein